MATVASNLAVSAPTPATNPAVSPNGGLFGLLTNLLVDDAAYVTNKMSLDVDALYNSSIPHGKGKFGWFGAITVPMSQQSAVGIGGGSLAGRTFVTPVTLNVGTTVTWLPRLFGKVYTFVGDGLLYDSTGKQFGNWEAVGFYKSWDIGKGWNLGAKGGQFDDSVLPGIGWFGGLNLGTQF